jgi:hypothetical protein
MIGAREIFAAAERLAWWHCVTVGSDRHEVAAALKSWRDRYGIWISNSALTMIAVHVTEAAAEEATSEATETTPAAA